jgi:hypothetical protein
MCLPGTGRFKTIAQTGSRRAGAGCGGSWLNLA